ncbi:MAG: hypothetical protein AAFY88_10380, partial [Acidobacteriota bacterium]
MKPRRPGTAEDAISRISGHLGAEVTGDLIGRTGSLIRKAGDPDNDVMLNILQCVPIEAAYKAETGHTPILDWYAGELEKVGAPAHEPVSTLEVMGHCIKEHSEAMQALAKEPQTYRELCESLKELDEAAEAIERAKQNLQAKIDTMR